MFSSYWPASTILLFKVFKALSLVAGLGAAGTGLRAALLWRDASLIALPVYDPPVASIGDAPELHIMGAIVDLNALGEAVRVSGLLNARAAAWTAWAAILSGAAALIATV